MLQAWRIVKRRYADTAFDGEGARLHGGRWNSPGRAVVYASESRALATLEVLTGLQSIAVAPAYVLMGVTFDEGWVSALDAEDLPEGWNRFPPTPASQHLGDDWLATERSAVLRVPSVIVPGEFNYLLNPTHPDFAAIKIGAPEELTLDPRLLP